MNKYVVVSRGVKERIFADSFIVLEPNSLYFTAKGLTTACFSNWDYVIKREDDSNDDR